MPSSMPTPAGRSPLLFERKKSGAACFFQLKASFENVQTTNDDIDLTRTSYPIELGTRHPLSLVKKEICDIFGRLGFSIAEGPEIEDDRAVYEFKTTIGVKG